MIVRKLRLQRSWSQEQLSQVSGLSVRTIQRIERGQKSGLESLKSLAAVFEIQVNELQQESEMKNHIQLTFEEENALEYVKSIKDFYTHLIIYIAVMSFILISHMLSSPDDYTGVLICAAAWGTGVVINGLVAFEVFSLFTPDWEKKQIERRLGRKL
jgi:transcriptional regulator with XRE-family HTH domain